MNKSRVAKWDNVKFLLILLVVVGHVADLYTKNSHVLAAIRFYIYIFHMPAFIFVSGLMSKKTIDNKNWRKIGSYVLLYFAVKFLLFAFGSVAKNNYTLTLFRESGVPWFMIALFFMNAITIYTKKFKPSWVLGISLVLSFFAGYGNEQGNFLAYLRVINFYPYFYLGYIIDPQKLLEKLDKLSIRIFSAIFLAASFAICWLLIDKILGLQPLLSGQNFYSSLGNYAPIGGFLRMGVFFAGLIMTLMLISITPKSKNVFTRFGERTLAIYATHYCLIYILFYWLDIKTIIQAALPHYWPIILLLIGCIITFVCGNKLFDKGFKALSNYDNKRIKSIEEKP
ncbi:MAG: acyltransferase family protein [Lachnospiraceae bacterium]